MTTTKSFRFSAGTMGSPVSREVHAGFCEKLRGEVFSFKMPFICNLDVKLSIVYDSIS